MYVILSFACNAIKINRHRCFRSVVCHRYTIFCYFVYFLFYFTYSTLSEALERSKRKYQSRIKRLEQQLITNKTTIAATNHNQNNMKQTQKSFITNNQSESRQVENCYCLSSLLLSTQHGMSPGTFFVKPFKSFVMLHLCQKKERVINVCLPLTKLHFDVFLEFVLA